VAALVGAFTGRVVRYVAGRLLWGVASVPPPATGTYSDTYSNTY
jgi:hypothetical protein